MNINVFIRHLPLSYHEAELNSLVQPYGTVVSSTVWRHTVTGQSKGFGLVQFSTEAQAANCIQGLDGFIIEDHDRALQVKFADNPQAKLQRQRERQQQTALPAALAPFMNELPFQGPSSRTSTASSSSVYPSSTRYPPTVPAYPSHAAVYSPTTTNRPTPARQVQIPTVVATLPEDGSNLFIRSLSSKMDELSMYKLFAQFGAVASIRVELDLATGVSKGYGFVKFFHACDALRALEALHGLSVDGKALDVTFHKPKVLV